MSRYDIVCENYENVTDSLFGDKAAFEEDFSKAARFSSETFSVFITFSAVSRACSAPR